MHTFHIVVRYGCFEVNMRRSMKYLCGVSAVVYLGQGLRVDDDNDVEIDTQAKQQLEARAGASADSSEKGRMTLKSIMDRTVSRKSISAQNAAKDQIARAAKAASKAKIEEKRRLTSAEQANEKMLAAKQDHAIATVALNKAETIIEEKRSEESDSWRVAEIEDAKEKAAVESKARNEAEQASDAKLQAEQHAKAAATAVRRAKAQVVQFEEDRFRSDEEANKYKEEEQAYKMSAELKKQELALQKRAEELATERSTIEAEVAAARQEENDADVKLSMENQAYNEAGVKGEKGEKEAKFALGQKAKYEKEVEAADAQTKKLSDEAYKKEMARQQVEFDANRLADEDKALMAESFTKRAQAEVDFALEKARRAKKQSEMQATNAATTKRMSEKAAASAEAQMSAARAAYASEAANKLVEEVKERKLAEAALKDKMFSLAEAFKRGNLEQVASIKADNEEAEEAMMLGEGKKVQADAADAASQRYKQEAAFQRAHRKRAQEAALKAEAAEEEHTKNAEDWKRQGLHIKAQEKHMPCANENGICVCKGQVIFGRRFMNGTSGQVRTLEQTLASAVRIRPCGSSLVCGNVVFGDPAPAVPKHCYCRELELTDHADDDSDDVLKLADDAMAMARETERTFYRDQLTTDTLMEHGQDLGEQVAEQSDDANRQLLKKTQRMENEAVRIKVEHGVGEVGFDDMDHHDMLG